MFFIPVTSRGNCPHPEESHKIPHFRWSAVLCPSPCQKLVIWGFFIILTKSPYQDGTALHGSPATIYYVYGIIYSLEITTCYLSINIRFLFYLSLSNLCVHQWTREHRCTTSALCPNIWATEHRCLGQHRYWYHITCCYGPVRHQRAVEGWRA